MQLPTTTSGQARAVSGLTNAEYHAHHAISKSGLDLIRRAPKLYKHKRENPSPATPSQRMGTLVHTALLEPDQLLARVAVAPVVDKRTTAGKLEWAQFQAALGDREIVTNDELKTLGNIHRAVWSHPACRQAMEMIAAVETSIFWTDPETGVECRCRPDAILSNGTVLDVKTTKDASLEGFRKAIANWRYHVQAAFYSDGLLAGFSAPPQAFAFLAVEVEEPHLCALYVLDPKAIIKGRAEYQADLRTYRQCLEADTWPGLHERPVRIDLPAWA